MLADQGETVGGLLFFVIWAVMIGLPVFLGLLGLKVLGSRIKRLKGASK